MRKDWPGCRWSLLRWFHSRSCSGGTACLLWMVDKVSPLPTVYVAAIADGADWAVLAALAMAVAVGADGADVALAGARASTAARMCARRELSNAASASPSA